MEATLSQRHSGQSFIRGLSSHLLNFHRCAALSPLFRQRCRAVFDRERSNGNITTGKRKKKTNFAKTENNRRFAFFQLSSIRYSATCVCVCRDSNAKEKEEGRDICISRKYACHRDVNRSAKLLRAWSSKIDRARRSKEDRGKNETGTKIANRSEVSTKPLRSTRARGSLRNDENTWLGKNYRASHSYTAIVFFFRASTDGEDKVRIKKKNKKETNTCV